MHARRPSRLAPAAVTLGVAALVTLAPPAAAQDAGVDWETLPELMDLAAANGFSGSILAVRGGKVVLERGYGHADPQGRHPVTPDTLFAIGSTPIDFTHGAILLLAQQGRVGLDEPVGTYLDAALAEAGMADGVPADKRAITVEHLRTGRSGLLDFPGIEGVDENLDLSWIDRAEFLRRVMSSELLFAPGADEAHSHAAWGVLAAIVEIVSGQGYEAFLREHFFGPAGMERTGHYPWARRFPTEEVAVGLGGNAWGEVNAPTHWGETSWLVLGSGGMVSTPRDLHRWRTFLAGGAVLDAEARRRYGIGGSFLDVGGNDRGFVTTLGGHGDDIVIVCSNAHVERDDLAAEVARAAAGVGAAGPAAAVPGEGNGASGERAGPPEDER